MRDRIGLVKCFPKVLRLGEGKKSYRSKERGVACPVLAPGSGSKSSLQKKLEDRPFDTLVTGRVITLPLAQLSRSARSIVDA